MCDEIVKIINKAKEIKNFECREGGANENEISELENTFKITLPEDYKLFLSEYGYSVWFGAIICGFVDKGALFEGDADVIPTTHYYKNLYNNDTEYRSVSNKGVVIGSYDGGGYYFLFSNESERAGEVGLFLTETFGQEVSTFNSFTDYLSFLVTGAPEPTLADVDYEKIHDILQN